MNRRRSMRQFTANEVKSENHDINKERRSTKPSANEWLHYCFWNTCQCILRFLPHARLCIEIVRVCDCEKTTFLHEQDLRSATQARVVKILKVSTVILKNVDIFEITGLNHDGPESRRAWMGCPLQLACARFQCRTKMPSWSETSLWSDKDTD